MDQIITENFEKIAEHFGFDVREGRKCYLGCCPIHEGDNPTALNFYHNPGYGGIVGNWQCKTQDCHTIFGQNAIGFIRGLLSTHTLNWSLGDKNKVSYIDTVDWCEKFFGVKDVEPINKNDIAYTINRIYQSVPSKKSFNISNQQFINSGLSFPDQYYLTRNYQEKTLREFKVGYCSNPQKPMYSRSVVPLHNKKGNRIIGCLGRSIWEKCEICNSHHNPKYPCPPKDRLHIYGKWKNSVNFPSSTELYNFHRARHSIKQTGIALLVEGSPNVWRLFEAGFPMSLGCFGSKFTPEQKKVLDFSGANTIIIVPDAGEPGKILVNNVIELCKYTYNVITIEPSYQDDIGECNVETVKHILSPFVEKYKEKQ